MPDQKVSELNSIAAATADDLLYIVDNPGVLPVSKKITFANLVNSIGSITLTYGIVPLGAVIPIMQGLSGAATHAELIAAGYARYDGTTPASQGVASPTITAVMPNINAGAFIRGNTTSWITGGASGGADSINIQHSHTTDITHAHADTLAFTGPSHDHTYNTVISHTHTFNTSTTGFDIDGEHSHIIATKGNSASSGSYIENAADGTDVNISIGGSLNGTHGHYGLTDTTGSASGTTATSGTGACGKSGGVTSLGSTTPSSSNALSTTQSVVPVYFNAVYYGRVR